MKTKTVEFFIDIDPGWQDIAPEYGYLSACNKPNGQVCIGSKRVKIICELPCFGGSAEDGCTVQAVTKPASGYIEESEVKP